MIRNDTEIYEIVAEIDASGIELSDWETDFIGDLVDRDTQVFSIAQAEKIDEIYERL